MHLHFHPGREPTEKKTTLQIVSYAHSPPLPSGESSRSLSSEVSPSLPSCSSSSS